MAFPEKLLYEGLDGARRRVKVPAALVTDNREALLAAALTGAGIMRVGLFDPGLLASGALRRAARTACSLTSTPCTRRAGPASWSAKPPMPQ